jgi:hypothetical protein
MSTTFSLFKPLTPPQSITHAVSAHFLAPHSSDLVVVRSNYLEVYSLPPHAFDQQTTISSTNAVRGLTDQTLLQRKYDARLFGNVEGVR